MEVLTDIQKIKDRISWCRMGSMRMDGDPINDSLAGAGPLIRAVMAVANAGRLSQEDTMTLLAYHALLQVEHAYDRVLDLARNSARPAIVPSKPADSNNPFRPDPNAK